VRELPEGVAGGRIVETEAYVVGDAAGYAYRGMTRRNRSLFLEHGHAYIYLAYGSSYMLNVSSEMPGVGAGVLIRALEPLDGIPIMQLNRGIERLRDLARGPGRLTAALQVDRSLDGLDLCREGPLWLGRGDHESVEIGQSIGSAFRGMRTASCDFIFGTVRSSAVQDRSRNKSPPQSPSSSLERESGLEAPFPPQAIPSHCMNSSAAYECAGPSVSPQCPFMARDVGLWLDPNGRCPPLAAAEVL
jgi:DNA-3-methyladenine glycosylase